MPWRFRYKKMGSTDWKSTQPPAQGCCWGLLLASPEDSTTDKLGGSKSLTRVAVSDETTESKPAEPGDCGPQLAAETHALAVCSGDGTWIEVGRTDASRTWHLSALINTLVVASLRLFF